jgi:lipopolysaccharide biosynthesis regulator YciM
MSVINIHLKSTAELIEIICQQKSTIERMEEQLEELNEAISEVFLASFVEATRSNQKQKTDDAKVKIADYLRAYPTLTVCEKFIGAKLNLDGQTLGEALNELLLEGVIEAVERASGHYWRGIA